jgi:hypothetical protein
MKARREVGRSAEVLGLMFFCSLLPDHEYGWPLEDGPQFTIFRALSSGSREAGIGGSRLSAPAV